MTLDEARNVVLAGALHVREADSGPYDDEGIDRAIRFAGNDWCEYTHSVQGKTDVSLAAATSVFDITATSGLEEFDPICFKQAWINDNSVRLVAPHSVRRGFSGTINPTGRPTAIAFEGATRMLTDKETDAAYTLELFWWQPFTTITVGDICASDTTLNIQDRYLDHVLRLGAATALVYGDPDSIYASQGWKNYAEFRNSVAPMWRDDLGTDRATDPRTYRPASAGAGR